MRNSKRRIPVWEASIPLQDLFARDRCKTIGGIGGGGGGGREQKKEEGNEEWEQHHNQTNMKKDPFMWTDPWKPSRDPYFPSSLPPSFDMNFIDGHDPISKRSFNGPGSIYHPQVILAILMVILQPSRCLSK